MVENRDQRQKKSKKKSLKRLRCGTIEKEVSQILQLISEGAPRSLLPFYPV